MNEILSKAVDALKEDTPNIDYVRGMLETLLAMQPTTIPENKTSHGTVVIPPQSVMIGEVPMPMNIAAIKAMSDASAHD